MKLYGVLSFVALIMSFLAGFLTLKLSSVETRQIPISVQITELKNEFQSNHKPLFRFNPLSIYTASEVLQLLSLFSGSYVMAAFSQWERLGINREWILDHLAYFHANELAQVKQKNSTLPQNFENLAYLDEASTSKNVGFLGILFYREDLQRKFLFQ